MCVCVCVCVCVLFCLVMFYLRRMGRAGVPFNDIAFIDTYFCPLLNSLLAQILVTSNIFDDNRQMCARQCAGSRAGATSNIRVHLHVKSELTCIFMSRTRSHVHLAVIFLGQKNVLHVQHMLALNKPPLFCDSSYTLNGGKRDCLC